jgi:uncharacterized membrane protein YwaF
MSIPPAFQLFGTPHLLTLVLIAAVALVLPLVVRRFCPAAERPIAFALAALLLGQEGLQLVLAARREGLSVDLLPLHLCCLSI